MKPMLPKLACLCPTYNRAHLLPHALHSFLQQDYPADRCELIILDDMGQYVSQQHTTPKPWTLVSIDKRFRTMGEKRNCTAALASRDVDALVLWDDDDIYLPWTLRAHAAALSLAPWSLPSRVYDDFKGEISIRATTDNFHASWAFTRELFSSVRGYPFIQSGQDIALRDLFIAAGTPRYDPLRLGYSTFFIRRWTGAATQHLSEQAGDAGYYDKQKLEVTTKRVAEITPYWPADFVSISQKYEKAGYSPV